MSATEADFLLEQRGSAQELGAWVIGVAFGREGRSCVFALGDGATGPSAEEWAAWSDTVNYEIVTRIGARVARVVCDES